MKELLKKIWKIIKIFWGVIFSLCAITSVGLLFDKEASGTTVPALLLIGICGYLAYICLKKTKNEIPDLNTDTTDIMSSSSQDNYSTYIFDDKDNFICRADGKNLTNDDAKFLAQVGFEKAIQEEAEIRSRSLTSNIITHEVLNNTEIIFFNALSEKLLESKLNPGYIALERMGSGALAVRYYGIYVGKIFLAEKDTVCSYRVMKIGNTRASRVFNNRKAAENYIQGKTDYYIDEKKTYISSWMQCPVNDYKITDMHNIDVNTAINTIPKWIKYIKRSMRNFI